MKNFVKISNTSVFTGQCSLWGIMDSKKFDDINFRIINFPNGYNNSYRSEDLVYDSIVNDFYEPDFCTSVRVTSKLITNHEPLL